MNTSRLSKSRYVAGLQCDKLLWLKAHEPDAPELVPSTSLQGVFDAGHRVGERARAEFQSGTMIELDPRDPGPAIAATRRAVGAGAPVIFEACFEADGAFAAIDVLERRRGGWNLLEVKSTLAPRPKHVPDLAIQVHLARRNGLCVRRAEVMHLNPEHRHPDLGPLFERGDVTQAVLEHEASVSHEIARQLDVLSGACPEVPIGDHCHAPYDCPFKSRCWPERPKHDVSELYKMSHKAEVLRARGYRLISELPEEECVGEVRARQRRAVVSGQVAVDPGLSGALAALPRPLAFLDFETVAPVLPIWLGCAPRQAVAVQYSVHRLHEDGAVSHREFLACPGSDPREELARHLLDSTRGVATVLAWNAGFERRRIEELAEHLRPLRDELADLAGRVKDLLAIVRDHVYHPDFRGSFSLKSVGPALVPELAYRGLEIADGMTASAELEKYLMHGPDLTEDQRRALRSALLAYCGRDTLLLVRIHEQLEELAKRHAL